jgi:hypothetical protein
MPQNTDSASVHRLNRFYRLRFGSYAASFDSSETSNLIAQLKGAPLVQPLKFDFFRFRFLANAQRSNSTVANSHILLKEDTGEVHNSTFPHSVAYKPPLN